MTEEYDVGCTQSICVFFSLYIKRKYDLQVSVYVYWILGKFYGIRFVVVTLSADAKMDLADF